MFQQKSSQKEEKRRTYKDFKIPSYHQIIFNDDLPHMEIDISKLEYLPDDDLFLLAQHFGFPLDEKNMKLLKDDRKDFTNRLEDDIFYILDNQESKYEISDKISPIRFYITGYSVRGKLFFPVVLGKPNGFLLETHSNGTVRIFSFFDENGKLSDWLEFDNNGNLLHFIPSVNGTQHGIEEDWRSGIKQLKYYINGEEVSKEEYNKYKTDVTTQMKNVGIIPDIGKLISEF